MAKLTGASPAESATCEGGGKAGGSPWGLTTADDDGPGGFSNEWGGTAGGIPRGLTAAGDDDPGRFCKG
eukprot:5297270-Heterocapsa_arctica.AAC.1